MSVVARHPAALVVGIAGGSGSGKSTLARALAERLGPTALHLAHDRYYHSLPEGTAPADFDFDRPEALDTARLVADLEALRSGSGARLPRYDFATHRRLPDVDEVGPREVILLEGILVLWEPALAPLLDHRVYAHASEEVRLARRVERDRAERGRSPDDVRAQFARSVRPMHLRFVEPCRARADVEVDGAGDLHDAVAALLERLALSRRRAAP